MSHISHPHSAAFAAPLAPARAMLEATLLWGTTVVTMRHLPMDHGVSVGESGDLFVPEEVLGEKRIELIGKAGAIVSQALLVDGAAPLTHSLGAGHTAHASFGAFVVTVKVVEKEDFPVARLLEGLAVAGLGATALSALAHGGLLGAFALIMPAMGSDDAELQDREKMLRMRAYLDAAAQREAEAIKTTEVGQESDSEAAKGGGKAMGEAGLMGKPEASSSGKWAAKKNFDSNDVTFNRERALSEAKNSDMAMLVGSLSASMSQDGPVAPWGSTLNGQDTVSASGNFWDANIGDAVGIGLSDQPGFGPGGGGNNIGIGINDIGGLSKSLSTRLDGNCTDDTCGSGTHHGKFRGGHAPRGPVMREAKLESDGTIPREVIQRIVRQNFGRFRNCYEGGLRTNPGLSGRVAVKFVIDRTGTVNIADDGGSDIPDQGVRSCVVKSFYSLSFPAPDHGSVRVVYPIMFSPGES